MKVLLATLFLLGFLVVSLVVLSELRRLFPAAPTVPPAGAPAVVSIEDVRVEVESALLRSGASLDRLSARMDGGRLRIDVQGAYPDADVRLGLERRLARMSPRLQLQAQSDEGRMGILWGDEVRVLLQFRPPAGAPATTIRPRLAIVMDDLGGSMATARSLLEIDLPVTLAILPGTVNAAAVATLAHRRQREVMVHIPMEPQGFPKMNPGRDALLVDHSVEEIRRRFQGYLDRIPYAVGGNNHMGSRFTEYRRGMATVTAEMKREGLFFIDSLTSADSIAFQEARRAGLPAAVRDVFLDNEQDVQRISERIRELVAVAKRRGSALGICHPHPQTLEALRLAVPYLEKEGVTVVPASQILLPSPG